MKRLICFLLTLCLLSMPVISMADGVAMTKVEPIDESGADISLYAVCESKDIEVGDQFMVSFVLVGGKEYLTAGIYGSFDPSLAQVIAPVYENEDLGVVTNRFDNENGTFMLEGYDQTISGMDEPVVCSILFEATNAGEFTVDLSDECLIGKVGENDFYVLDIHDGTFTISEDSDEESVLIIEEPEPLTPYDDMLYYDWAEKAVGVMYKLGALENIADTSFKPGENITRGEFITMLMKVCRLEKAADEGFADVKEDSYQYKSVMSAKALGITNGDDEGNFRPDEPITRQDICTLVFRTMVKMNKVDAAIDNESYISAFEDGTQIAEYAKDSVAGLIRAKLLVGDDSGLLRPLDNMTRAEAAVLLNRLAEYNILISR